jgi:hypothetical protein
MDSDDAEQPREGRRVLSYARPPSRSRARLPWLALAAALIAWVPVFVAIISPAPIPSRLLVVALSMATLMLAISSVARPARHQGELDLFGWLAAIAALAGLAASAWLSAH